MTVHPRLYKSFARYYFKEVHYWYSKIFEVNYYEVVYPVLMLSGTNITMLVKFILCHCYHCLVAHQEFGKGAQNQGSGGEAPSHQQIFNGFHIKNTHLSTLFIDKGRTILAVSVVSNRQYKNTLVGLPKSLDMFNSTSLAKINQRRMQLY